MHRSIIDYAMDDNGAEFRKELYSAIYDKVTNHIEAKKQEVAENLLGLNQESDEDEEELDDDYSDELEDEESEEEELGEGNAALNAFDKATKRSAAARRAGQELLGQTPKKQGLPFDPDKKSAFKKSNNPNRSGIDTARALAQKGMTNNAVMKKTG